MNKPNPRSVRGYAGYTGAVHNTIDICSKFYPRTLKRNYSRIITIKKVFTKYIFSQDHKMIARCRRLGAGGGMVDMSQRTSRATTSHELRMAPAARDAYETSTRHGTSHHKKSRSFVTHSPATLAAGSGGMLTRRRAGSASNVDARSTHGVVAAGLVPTRCRVGSLLQFGLVKSARKACASSCCRRNKEV